MNRFLFGLVFLGGAIALKRGSSEQFGASFLPTTKVDWILAILERSGRPMAPTEVAGELGFETDIVGATLQALLRRGLVSVESRPGKGGGGRKNFYSFVKASEATSTDAILDLLERSGEITSREVADKLEMKMQTVVDLLRAFALRGQVSVRSRPGRGRGGEENVYLFVSRTPLLHVEYKFQSSEDLIGVILSILRRENRPMTGWEISKYLGIGRKDKDQVFDVLRRSGMFSVVSRPSPARGGLITHFYYPKE